MICARLIVLQRQMAWSLALGRRHCILGKLLQDGVILILFVSAVGQKTSLLLAGLQEQIDDRCTWEPHGTISLLLSCLHLSWHGNSAYMQCQ